MLALRHWQRTTETQRWRISGVPTCRATSARAKGDRRFHREKDCDFQRSLRQHRTQIATLTAYRKSLIHECVTGQRRITEADINRVKRMAKRKKAPELTFQQHIADYLVREHEYGVLEQSDITDTEHFIAEDQLWAFLKATQADTLKKLADDYGTDAREEVFKALRKELEHTPLWMLLRQA